MILVILDEKLEVLQSKNDSVGCQRRYYYSIVFHRCSQTTMMVMMLMTIIIIDAIDAITVIGTTIVK